MRSRIEFPYSDAADSRKTRALVTALLFLGGAFFLWWGEASSLAEPRHGNRLTDIQNLAVNLLCAFILSIFGFLNLFWICRKRPAAPMSVIISKDRILAPKQGVLGRPVEILFDDITQMKTLSVDGVWEFNVASARKHIRVPKGFLSEPMDFDNMVLSMAQRVMSIEVETEQRIDPPRLES